MKGLILTLLAVLTPVATATTVDGGPKDKGVSYKYPLYRSWHDVFPDDLVEALIRDSKVLDKTAASNFKFGKRGTTWYPLEPGKTNKPRFAAEVAVHILKQLDFEGNAFEEQGIVGAEWWFQVRAKTDNIGFHYDKDEATASEEMRLVLPTVSTVSYLTNVGAPTMIFNQTSIDGNDDEPAIPVKGGLVFPQRNKHIFFRGNLMHGVSGSLGPLHAANIKDSLGDTSETRVTFLVNWWAYTPAPPNCIPADDKTVKLLTESSGDMVKYDGYATQAEEHAFEPLPLDGRLQDVVVEIPALERLHVPVPEEIATPNSYELDWNRETSEPILRGITLDLYDSRSTNQVFGTNTPKAIAFYRGEGEAKRNEIDHVFLKAVRAFDDYVPFVGEHSKVKEALKYFNIQRGGLPTVVVHDTANEQRYRMPRSSTFTVEAIREFLQGVKDGSVEPLVDRAKDEL